MYFFHQKGGALLNLEKSNTNNICLTKNKCYGCGACENICPHKAIRMTTDKEGFLYPEINIEKCTNCGLCKSVCPSLKTNNKNKTPQFYSVMASDKIRRKSSSGGVFPTLAYHFLENEGFVAGVVWENDGSAKHIISNKKDDIERMRTSKYIQSSIGNCYTEVKRILEKNYNVLFTGTPCQIAGLKTFLKKEYTNLFTLEIICHGVPSPKVFKQHLREELKENETFIATDFRDKVNGWSHDMIITTKTNLKTTSTHLEGSAYTRAFHENLCLRPCCGSCNFNKLPRQADMTMGDFWGVWDYNPKLDDKKGTSILLINNKKGEYLFKLCKRKFKLVKQIPAKYAINKNPNIVMPTRIDNEKREEFMNLIEKHTIKDSFGYCMDDKADCMILNFWHAINYGAILTCYGVQCLAEKLGLNTKVINYLTTYKKDYPNSFTEKFANKYLNLTKPINYVEDFINLNNKCSTFIVGSDQVWSPALTKELSDNVNETIYLLDFVKQGHKKLSYSASFGSAEFNVPIEVETIYKHYLKQFDSISVREDDGVEILNNLGIPNATQLIDGAFLIPKEKLEEMTAKYRNKEKYIAHFTLPCFKDKIWYKTLLSLTESSMHTPIKPFVFDKTTPVEEWLGYLKNSELIITDSYHAIVFAIIFNKPFVQIKNASSQNRFESLFRNLGIEDNSIGEYDRIDYNKIFIPRDWENINKKIEEEVQKAELWLKSAIDKETKDNSEYDLQNFLLTKQYLNNLETKKHLQLLRDKDKLLFKFYQYKLLNTLTGGKIKNINNKFEKYNTIKTTIKNL